MLPKMYILPKICLLEKLNYPELSLIITLYRAIKCGFIFPMLYPCVPHLFCITCVFFRVSESFMKGHSPNVFQSNTDSTYFIDSQFLQRTNTYINSHR